MSAVALSIHDLRSKGRYSVLFDGHDAEALAQAPLVQSAETLRPIGWHSAYRESLDKYAHLVADVVAQDAASRPFAAGREAV